MRRRFGKRLVIIVSEVDTGRERRLTPEDDAALPVRVAVRMSVGGPGLMEPVRYRGKDGSSHVYIDGGMCNDFPVNALPDDGHRLALMMRPREWMAANMHGIEHYVGEAALARVWILFLYHCGLTMLAAVHVIGCWPERGPLFFNIIVD